MARNFYYIFAVRDNGYLEPKGGEPNKRDAVRRARFLEKSHPIHCVVYAQPETIGSQPTLVYGQSSPDHWRVKGTPGEFMFS